MSRSLSSRIGVEVVDEEFEHKPFPPGGGGGGGGGDGGDGSGGDGSGGDGDDGGGCYGGVLVVLVMMVQRLRGLEQ